jgi:alkanesulfonate monooxygenase SsuD/methylene tetrahydromethanopterin reductase-like flavin-dependent oxidoreductase (luciferase family)
MAQRIDDDLLHTLAVAGTPEECAAAIVQRFGDHADRVCCYFPGYPVTDERIGELVAALHAAS